MNELETKPEEPKTEQRSIRDQLKEWGFDLDIFEERRKKAGGELKGEYSDVIKTVREKLDQAKVHLGEVAKAGKPAGVELKSGFERAWSEIAAAIKRAEEKVAQQKGGSDEPPSDPGTPGA